MYKFGRSGGFLFIFCIFSIYLIAATSSADAAPKAKLWPHWQVNLPSSPTIVDHSAWNSILGKYVINDAPSGINRFRYAAVTTADRRLLAAYLRKMQSITVSNLNRQEQKAYWINLYNALTVKVILDHYPVKSIMDIDISPGFFSNGPWDAKLLKIEGQDVSLNDIEHRILRPVFKDNRVHYAVNCASLGCPNLQDKAFTSSNTEQLLKKGAHDFINHPRGVHLRKGRLTVSSIYKWFQADFGGNEAGVIKHLQKYADAKLATTLSKYRAGLKYDYNWQINEPTK